MTEGDSGPRWAMALVAVGLLAVMVWGAWDWRGADGRPPRGDEARHLTAAVRVARGEAVLFPDPGLTYPPLGYWVLAPAGREPARAPLAQSVFLAVLAGALALAGARLGGPWCGFLAVLLACASPLLQVVLRTGYVDLGLAAFTTLGLALLVRCEGFSRGLESFLAGVAAGLAALVKFGFLLFLAVPALLAFAGWPGRPDGARPGRGLALFAAGLALTAAPWYLAGLRIFQRMAEFLGGRVYVPAEAAPGSLEAWQWVLWVAVDWLWGLPVALAVAWGLVQGFRRGERAAAGLAACTLAPLLVLALLPHRGPHYALPVLGPSALLAGLALSRSRARGAVAVLAVLLALAVAWGGRWQPPGRDVLFEAFCTVCPAGSLVGDVALLAGPPLDPSVRPLEALVRAAGERAAPLPPEEAPLYPRRGSHPGATVALAGDLPPEVEDEALRYQAARAGLRLRFGVLGRDLEPEDADLLLARPETQAPGGYVEAGRFGFPGGAVRLLVRPGARGQVRAQACALAVLPGR